MSTLLEHHRETLASWRKAMNLVGPGDIGVHYDDASRALAGLEPTGRWVDLGTGAGFPGIVLAAEHPDLQVDLVDSRRKRCVFLEHVLGGLPGPDGDRDRARVRVLCQRVEALPAVAYDGVTARAFAPPEAVMEHARRLLKPGGTLVLFLQGDARVPPSADFREERDTPYTVGGKARRAVSLRWVGA